LSANSRKADYKIELAANQYWVTGIYPLYPWELYKNSPWEAILYISAVRFIQ